MEKKLIVLDPGHGQFGNEYPILKGRYEGNQNFRLAQHLKAALEARGFDVLLTRNAVEDDPALAARGGLAGEKHARMFLSLHSNAPGSATPPERYNLVRGSEVYYSLADEENNARLARALNRAVVETMHTEDRGVKTRSYPDQPGVDYYGVLRAAAASGCHTAMLIEHGFHTNPEDAAFLTDEDCLERLANAEADVLLAML